MDKKEKLIYSLHKHVVWTLPVRRLPDWKTCKWNGQEKITLNIIYTCLSFEFSNIPKSWLDQIVEFLKIYADSEFMKIWNRYLGSTDLLLSFLYALPLCLYVCEKVSVKKIYPWKVSLKLKEQTYNRVLHLVL